MRSVRIYYNLQSAEVQRSIKKDCCGRSGIYIIKNLKNNKKYIGSVVSKTFLSNRLYDRFRNHFFHNQLSSPVLRRAIQKYSINCFCFIVRDFPTKTSPLLVSYKEMKACL